MKRKRRRSAIGLAALILALLVVVAACGGDDDTAAPPAQEPAAAEPAPAEEPAPADPAPAEPAPAEEPAPADPAPAEEPAEEAAPAEGQSLVVASFDVPTSLDPESPQIGHEPSSQAMANLFEPLLTFGFKENPDGSREPDFDAEFQGRLAESWEISEDETVWTFNLRRGVQSAWGNEFTAADYLWSAERAFALGSFGFFFMFVSNVGSLDSIQALDDYTLEFTLDAPSQIFAYARALWLAPVFDSTEVKLHVTDDDPWASEWIGMNGGGFGPYVVENLVPAQEFVLKANPNYYLGPPSIETVTVKAVPSSATRLASLTNGSVDIAENLAPQELAALEGNDDVKISQILPGNRNQWLIINTQKGPLIDKLVRQAIAYTIPYDDILNSVFLGRGVVYKNVVPLGYPDVTDEYWHYDTDLATAQQLLDQAGQGEGFDITLTYSSGFPQDEQVAIFIKDALEQIGINATLEKVTAAVFADKKNNPESRAETDILLSSGDLPWVPDFLFTSVFFFRTGATFNGGWSSPEYDSLSDAAAIEIDPSKRTELIGGMQEILMEELPYIGIALTGLPVPMAASVNGYTWYTDNWIRYYDLSNAG